MSLKGTGTLAKKMLGFADDFITGATKGTDAQVIKASVNKVKSNMTNTQKNVLKNAKFKPMQEVKDLAQSTAHYKTKGQIPLKGNVDGRIVFPSGGKVAGTINTKNSKVLNSSNNIKIGQGNATFAAKTGDFFGGGTRETINGLKAGKKFKEATKDAFMDGDKLRMDRVAGTFMATSAAGRIATGGGLYKDKNGNTNIIGLPFI